MMAIIFLLPLYFLTIQAERGGLWRIFWVFGLVALPLDVFLNYTELALVTGDFPKHGEWTFSTRLNRLQNNPNGQGNLARYIVKVLNAIAPSGRHI